MSEWNNKINNNSRITLPRSEIMGTVVTSLTPLTAWLSNGSPSSTYLKTSLRTKYPLSCGARKNDCANFLLKLSLPVRHPVTNTVTPSL